MAGPKQNWATEGKWSPREFLMLNLLTVSVERNTIPILNALDSYLSKSKSCLEIASGWGDHVRSWANAFPDCAFQPTEEDDEMLRRLHMSTKGHHNIRPPLRLDVLNNEDWHALQGSKPFDLMLANNLLHVAPW